MPQNNNKICMSTKDITKDVYIDKPDSGCNCWVSQGIRNYPTRKLNTAMIVDEREIDMFLQFLDKVPVIQEFLKNDTCSKLADKYLLAMVFTYFKRAQYAPQEFTCYNFFVALFLAHDTEEDDEDIKCELYVWTFGFHWQWQYQELLTSRETLWKVIGHRGIVSRACCEKVMSLQPNHPIWQRNRAEIHAGANRPYDETSESACSSCCKLKSVIKTTDSDVFESSDDTDSISSDNLREISQSPVNICEVFMNE